MLRDKIKKILNTGVSGDLDAFGCAEYNPELVDQLLALFNSNLKEQREKWELETSKRAGHAFNEGYKNVYDQAPKSYQKGREDALKEFTANELRRYNTQKQREHRAKLATNTLEVKEI